MEQLEQAEDVDGLAFQHGPTLDVLDDAYSNDAKAWLAGYNLVATVPARDWLLVSKGNKLDIYRASKFLARAVNDSNFNFETCILDRIAYPADILNLVANYNKAACFCKDGQGDKKYLVILDFESRMQVELKLECALVDLSFACNGNSNGFGDSKLNQSQKAAAPSRTFNQGGDLLNLPLDGDASKEGHATDCLLMTDANSCLYKHDGNKLVRFKVSALRVSEPLNGRLVLAKVHDSKVYIGATSINKDCKLGTTNYHELILQEPDVATDVLGVCALPNDYIALVVALQDDGDSLLAIAKATANELIVEYMGFNELFIDVDGKEFVNRVNCNLMWNEAWRCLFCWSNCASNVAIVSCNESLTRAPEGIWRSLCMREGFFLECTRPNVFPRGLGICTSFKETLYRKGACADTPPLTRPPVIFLAQSDASISIAYVDVWVITDSTQVQVLPFEVCHVCDDDDDDDDDVTGSFEPAPVAAPAPSAKSEHVSNGNLPMEFDALKIIDGWQRQLLQRFKAIEKPSLQELERLVLSETLANALVMLEKSMVVCDAINGKIAQSLEAHANDRHVFNVPKVPEGAQERQEELLKQLNALQLDLSSACNGKLSNDFGDGNLNQSQKDAAPSRTINQGGDLLNLPVDTDTCTYELVSRAQGYSSNICSALGDEKSLSLLARGCRSWMQEAEVNLDATAQLLSSLKEKLGTLEQRLDKLENRRCARAVEHLNSLKISDAALEKQESREQSKTIIAQLDTLLDEFQSSFKCRQAHKFQPSTLYRPVESSGCHYNEAAALVCKYDFTTTSSSSAAADANVGDTTTLDPQPATVEAIKVDTVRDASNATLFSSATKVEAPAFGFGSSANDATLPPDLGGFQVQQYTFGQSSGLLSGPATVSAGASATPSVGTSVFSSFASKPSSLLDIATGAVGTPTAKGFAYGANTSLNFGKGLFGSVASNSGSGSTQNVSSGTFTGVSGFTSGTFAPSTCLGSTSSPQGDFWNRARSSNPLD